MSEGQRTRGAELQARAEAVFGGGDPTDDRSHLIGMYQGIVQALRPLTRDYRYGATVEDYGHRMIDQLLTLAEDRLSGEPAESAEDILARAREAIIPTREDNDGDDVLARVQRVLGVTR